MFESMCIRDLRVYAEATGGKVYHYRDKNGLECDAVIVLRDGRWSANCSHWMFKELGDTSTNLMDGSYNSFKIFSRYLMCALLYSTIVGYNNL
jgi:uncharacterized protein YjhX (UPF0386 family)